VCPCCARILRHWSRASGLAVTSMNPASHFQRSAGATQAVSAMIGMSMPAARTWQEGH